MANKITFEQLLASIAGQETGGMSRKEAYSVVNAWGAVGKYQVLKSNIPQWSKAALGYSITWQKYRDSPELQERIVRHRLGGYYRKYGDRGAAAAWYSGDPKLHMNTNSQPGGPSIKKYVDDVIARGLKVKAGKNPAPGATGGGSSGGTTYSAAELAENYGYVIALMNSNPELKKLFDKATKGQWTTEKFQAELRDTKWFKTRSKTEREYLIKMYGDPATAKQEMAQAQLKVAQMAKQMGVTGPALAGTNMKALAYKVVALGWTDAQVRFYLGRYVAIGDSRTGEAGELEDQLREYAYNMGVAPSDAQFDTWVRDAAKGVGTQQDAEDAIRKLAKSHYSAFAKQIDSGQSVADIASPYMQSMAQLLELPQGSVNLFDPTIKKALQYKDAQGTTAIKPLWQFENELRNDERWKKTTNAQNSLMQVAHQVLADFGVKY